MVTSSVYPYNHHPCYSLNRGILWHRIHLPVAPVCNVKCAFCSQTLGSSCHSSKPGFSSQIMTPDIAVNRTRIEIDKNPNLKIVAISGPGEPLANIETFETLERIRMEFQDISMCLSTNGVLLSEYVDWLKEVNVATVSVSMSTPCISTASKIYEWARFQNTLVRGEIMASKIIDAQINGIRMASNEGIHVKVNSILIPEINMHDMVNLAGVISRAGAELQNIVPLVPNDKLSSNRAPSFQEIQNIRKEASSFIEQFTYCKQCRSDVVGIPGCDSIL
ncbi:MAG: radical SAM protein [Candidatus Thorarchaeota archaeon]